MCVLSVKDLGAAQFHEVCIGNDYVTLNMTMDGTIFIVLYVLLIGYTFSHAIHSSSNYTIHRATCYTIMFPITVQTNIFLLMFC